MTYVTFMPVTYSATGTGKMHATIVASKPLLNKLGSRRITKWDRGTIEFIYYRETNAPKAYRQSMK